jgi:hypothetical protein
MATYTITIHDRTNKTKHLLGLIRELAEIENKYIEINREPNDETIEALRDAEAGRVTHAKNKSDFFNKLND